MSDHERIYLQPECCAQTDVGRLWCQDPDPEECEEGVPWTEYVRADVVVALREREERYREALKPFADVACSPPFACLPSEDECGYCRARRALETR